MGLQRVRHACLTKHMHSGVRHGKGRRQEGVLTLGSSGAFYRQSHPLASTTGTASYALLETALQGDIFD